MYKVVQIYTDYLSPRDSRITSVQKQFKTRANAEKHAQKLSWSLWPPKSAFKFAEANAFVIEI